MILAVENAAMTRSWLFLLVLYSFVFGTHNVCQKARLLVRPYEYVVLLSFSSSRQTFIHIDMFECVCIYKYIACYGLCLWVRRNLLKSIKTIKSVRGVYATDCWTRCRCRCPLAV